jgi:hypothetical protein
VASHSRCVRDAQSKDLNLFLVPCSRICPDRVVSCPSGSAQALLGPSARLNWPATP